MAKILTRWMSVVLVALLTVGLATAQTSTRERSDAGVPAKKEFKQRVVSERGLSTLKPLATTRPANTAHRDGYLTWSGEYGNNGVGTGFLTEFAVAHRFEPSDLTAYNGQYISHVQFVPTDPVGTTFTLKIWQGGDLSGPATVVYEQLLNTEAMVAGEWNEFNIIPAVQIDDSQELWIGYDMVSSGWPAGIDYGPAVMNKGNLMFYEGVWDNLMNLGGMDVNFAIRAHVQEEEPLFAYPMACTDLTVTADPNEGLAAELSWTNPSLETNGSPLTSLSSIEILRDGVLIHSLTGTNPGEEVIYVDETLPAPGVYTYTVFAVNEAGSSPEISASAAVGPMCSFTVTGGDYFGDGWNDAAILFQTEFGTTVASFTILEGDYAEETFSLPIDMELFCVWQSGVYDSEVYGITITDNNGVLLYEIDSAPNGTFFTFVNSCSANIPNAPTNFEVEPAPENALSATISWTNPTECVDGSDLVMTSVILMRDDEVIYTVSNPTNGANESFVDNGITESGIYNYKVYAVNAAGNGQSVSKFVGIGGIYVMQRRETLELTACSGTVYDNGGPDGDYQMGSNDRMIIYPASENSSVSVQGTYVIESPFDKLYIYDGVGTVGTTLLNVYSNSNGGTINEVSFSGPLTLHFYADGSVAMSGFELFISCVQQSTVSGQVTELATGNPIPNATITFTGDGTVSTTTDETGHYNTGIIAGTYTITVTADGYNTITESNFVIPESGVSGKNFQMTAPTMTVSPLTMDITTGYGVPATATFTITNNGNGDLNWNTAINYDEMRSSRDQWDLVGTFTTETGGMQAIVSDGEFIYTASWLTEPPSGNTFEKYTADFQFIEGFNIPGVNAIRDLTYDGEYFYCSSGNTAIYCVDFEARTLVSTINTTATVRHCSYDPDRDGFWVGDWASLFFINRNGAILETGPAIYNIQAYGSGYDNVTEGGPYLLFHGQPAGNALVFQYNIATQEYTEILNMNVTPGYTDGLSGGAYVGMLGRKICFFGNTQQDPNLVGIYELGEVGWISAIEPADGVVTPGSSATVTVDFDEWFEEQGAWTGNITVGNVQNIGDEVINISYAIAAPECDAPQNLTATTANFNVITLSWSAPQNAAGLTEYRIFRQGSANLLATVPAGTTSHVLDGVAAGEHTFVVRAYYAADNCLSLPSNAATTTATDPTGNVSGTVTDAITGDAIAGAIVTIGTFTATTNGSGAYTIANAIAGTHTATVTANGYETYTGTATIEVGNNTINFTLNIAPCDVQPENLTANVTGTTVTLSWTMPDPASVTVILEAHDVWGDGTGYQLLLDADANEFGNTIPASGALYANCSAPANLYNVFEYKIPENADPNCTTNNIVSNGSKTIHVPAGTYDFCLANPTPGEKIWIAAGNNGRRDNYEMLDGYTYHFTAFFNGNNDEVSIDVTPAKRAENYTFNVYRDGVKIASGLTNTAYTDNNVPSGEHCYTVTAVCQNGEESQPSNEVCDVVNSISEEEGNIQVYPNPADTKLVIKGENINNIAMFNVLGQMIINQQVTDNETIINTNALENGVYVIRISHANGNVSTERIVITH